MTLKLRAKVNFPASVTGAAGITVTKQNGIWIIAPGFGSLVELDPITDPSSRQIWLYTPATGEYNVTSITALTDAVQSYPVGSDLDMDSHKIINLADGTDDGDAINKGQADAAYMPVDATLTAIAGVTTAADEVIYATGVDTFATTPLTPAARSLLDDTSASDMRTTLGVVPGTDVQAYDAGLASIAGLTTLADKMIYTTASDTYAVTTITSYARTLLDDADASTARTTLGLAIGTNVQAYNARLADIAGITFAQGDLLYFNGTNLVNLGPGTDGQFLKTQGAGANPVWTTIPGGGDMLSTNNLSDVASADTSLDNLGGTTVGKAVFKATDAAAGLSALSGAPLAGNKNLTGGFTATSYSAGTKSSGTFTPDPLLGNIQHATNNGAHTLAPPSSPCTMVIEYTNGASAGTVTTSGFTRVTGDPLTTTSANKFVMFIVKTSSYSSLDVVALQ